MSLTGLTVAVTGSRRASELAALISNHGGTPYVAPTVGIRTIEQLDEDTLSSIKKIVAGEVQHAIFMTGPGTYALMGWVEELGVRKDLIKALNKIHVIARSQKPAQALSDHGVHVDLVPDDNTSEGIAEEMKALDLRGKTVMVLWYGEPKANLKRELERQGARVLEAMVYNYSRDLSAGGEKILRTMGFKPIPPDEKKIIDLISNIGKGLIDAITFTSPPSARNLFQIAANHNLAAQLKENLNQKVIVVSVGRPTRETVESNEVNVDVMPEDYKLGAMIKALDDYVRTRKGKAVAILEKIHNQP